MRLERTAAAALVAATLLLAVGGFGEKLGEVSGTVSYDGKPVEAGSIRFVPENGKNPEGAVIIDGKYKVANLPPGPAKIVITGDKVVSYKMVELYKDSKEKRPVTEQY